MDEESGRGDRKVKKEKKHKKHKKRAKDVEEDPVDSERGPDPQQQAKDKYNQSAPKDIEQKQVINWEDINYPPVLRLFHYKYEIELISICTINLGFKSSYHELKTPIEFQICQWEQWIFIFQSAILMFNRKSSKQRAYKSNRNVSGCTSDPHCCWSSRRRVYVHYSVVLP